jgi:thymidylate synthase (FAD)
MREDCVIVGKWKPRNLLAKVYLFSYDPDVERVCAAAMRSCYSPHPGYSLYTYTGNPQVLEGEKIFDTERVQYFIRKSLELGHHDILEHGALTFDMQGMSRACSHQLVRHRLASFSQQSQRYVKITRSYGYLKPPSIPKDIRVPITIGGKTLELNFEDVMDITRQVEEGFVKLGLKAEDARYVRPNAATTNLVMSMNPRQLLHVFTFRCAPDAQWEIRCWSWAMYACARLIAPTIFETIPQANQSMQDRVATVGRILADVRPKFESVQRGDIIDVPLADLKLEMPVEASVLKV